MEKNNNIHRSKSRMLFNNFLGGIAWAIGVWVGTTFFVAIMVFFLSKINYIPFIGNFVADVIVYISRNKTF